MNDGRSDTQERPFLKGVEGVYRGFFDELERHIAANIDSIDINELKQLYLRFFNVVKKRSGTSAGFTGVSEHLFLELLLNYLRQKLKLGWKDVPPTEYLTDIRVFESEIGRCKLMVTHSAFLKPISDKRKGIPVPEVKQRFQPDISVILKREDKRRLIAIFSIKIYPVKIGLVKDEIIKLGDSTSRDVLNCGILLQPPKNTQDLERIAEKNGVILVYPRSGRELRTVLSKVSYIVEETCHMGE